MLTRSNHMNSFLVSFNAVTPMFLLMLLGYLLRKAHFFDDTFVSRLNKTTFNIFIPVMIFADIYQTTLSNVFHVRLTVFSLSVILATCVLAYLVTGIIKMERKTRGAVIQGIFRGNFALYGLPLIVLICGMKEAASASVLMSIVVPLFNVLAVIILAIFGESSASVKNCMRSIFKNPLIIGCAAGLLAQAIHLHLPVSLEQCCTWLGDIAIPMCLIILGASVKTETLHSYIGVITVSSLIRLVIAPTLIIALAIALRFRGVDLLIITALFSSPTSITSYPMSVEMKINADVTCGMIVLTTIFSTITVFFFTFIIQYLGFFTI